MAAASSGFDQLLKVSARTRVRRLAAVGGNLATAWLGAIAMAHRLERQPCLDAINRWAGSITRDLGLAVVTKGPGRPAEGGGVLFVANHVSWLDICAIASLTGTLFVAKSEVASWPVIGRIAASFGNFLHERGNLLDVARVKRRVAGALHQNWRVTVFPEGTTGWGSALGPFYPALAQAAIDAGARVQPVAIRYWDAHGRPSQAAPFVGEQTFVNSLRGILREPGITAELHFGPPFAAAGRTRREITRITHRFIAEALGVDESRIAADPRRLRRRGAH